MRRFGAHPVADHHDPLHGFAPRQEFGLGQHRWAAPAGVTTVATALPLGLQPGRAVNPLDLAGTGVLSPGLAAGARRALVHDGVGRVVGRRTVVVVVARAGLAAPAPATTAGRAFARTVVLVAVVGVIGLVVGILAFGRLVALIYRVAWLVVALGAVLFTATATAAPAPAATALVGGTVRLVIVIVRAGLCVGVIAVVGILGRTLIAGFVVGLDALGQRLRRDEQRHVVRALDQLLGLAKLPDLDRFQHQPGFGFGRRPGFGDGRGVGVGLRRVRLGRQQIAYPNRVDVIDAGVGTADPPVEGGQGIQHPPAGGSQRPRERMHPQAVGQVLPLGRLVC